MECDGSLDQASDCVRSALAAGPKDEPTSLGEEVYGIGARWRLAVDARRRRAVEAVLGTQEATTLMEHLPPVGWADVATKRDLDSFSNGLRADWRRDLLNAVFAVLAASTALAGLVFAAARIA